MGEPFVSRFETIVIEIIEKCWATRKMTVEMLCANYNFLVWRPIRTANGPGWRQKVWNPVIVCVCDGWYGYGVLSVSQQGISQQQ